MVSMLVAGQATSPTSQHYNSDTLKVIVELINKEPNGPAVALRLLAHKIQSPQEREALCALTILESLTKQCDRQFISELGKFKFINEIIKVLSPKHLGDQTTETVKAKCRKLLFEWQRDHGTEEPKFTAAYTMLCSQGLISPDSTVSSNGTPRSDSSAVAGDASRRKDIFDRNRHSERLTKLLRSRNPNDIAEANRIIKNIVEEDQQRMEKEARLSTEMESLKNNTLLLNEMTANYIRSGASESELELMSELDTLANTVIHFFLKFPGSYGLRASAAEIARICEQATNALEFYAEKVTKSGARMTPSSTTSISGPGMPDSPRLDLTNSPPRKRMETTENQKTTVNDLLSQDLLQLGLGDIDPTVGAVNQPSIDFSPAVKPATPTNYDELEDIFSKMADKMPVTASANPIKQTGSVSTTTVKNRTPSQAANQPCYNPFVRASPSSTNAASDNATKAQLFDDLDTLGRQMLGFNTIATSGKSSSTTGTAFISDNHSSVNDSLKRPDQFQLNGLADIPLIPTLDATSTETSPAHQSTASTNIIAPVDLSTLDVQLSAIEPHPRIHDPVRLYPDDSTKPNCSGVQLDLHYAGNRPSPDVSVFVAVVMNRSALPVTELLMRFAVNKPLHLRNLTASGESLSPYSPFLPVGAINQVVLIYDPSHQPTFNLKFQLSFNLGDEAILESGSQTIPSA
ncbi:ADP-ribosylation factor-binding protein GGA1 [Fasciolopsis buskii]|uniref:ADP-ribosylation factor-binding protein GGA1 n=1 Tax=Fasciolopsis buskii TaxID=27845 RepID=A0A8E0RXH6_9TREM|nr:ADP-ribosylation factor-binding protein GGA1 [Fasciolopsis buski]